MTTSRKNIPNFSQTNIVIFIVHCIIEKAVGLILFCWLYATIWNIGPFVGWGRYIPEGILDSCSFDYLTRDQAVRLKKKQQIFLFILISLRFQCLI